MIAIRFFDNRPTLRVKAETLGEAVRKALAKGYDLTRSNLREADLRQLYLKDVDLSGADLFSADLREADLRGAKLCNANLRKANLSEARMCEANLRDAILSEANLSRTSLTKANLKNADLRYANLRGAHLFDTNLKGADLDYSCLPLWCGSLKTRIDKRIFCQLLYHTLRAGQSVDDTEVKKLFAIPEVVALANKFHRAIECGIIFEQEVR